MDLRKLWLDHLATSPAVADWAEAFDPEMLGDTARVETRNTTYLFRKGICFSVTCRDPSRGRSSDFVGLRLVGWLVVEGLNPRLTRTWRPGVCAVLWGTRGGPTLPVALTSPTIRFTRFTKTGLRADLPPRPKLDRNENVTFTRVNLPRLSRLTKAVAGEARSVARHSPPHSAPRQPTARQSAPRQPVRQAVPRPVPRPTPRPSSRGTPSND